MTLGVGATNHCPRDSVDLGVKTALFVHLCLDLVNFLTELEHWSLVKSEQPLLLGLVSTVLGHDGRKGVDFGLEGA